MELDVAGRKAYAYTGGRPLVSGRNVVVFVHGAQHDHSVWILQSRYLAHHGHSVLAVDLPGHGRSDGPALHSVREMAQWLIGFLDAAGIAKATLVGHSMGSLIVLETAARAPTRIERVALLSAAYPMQVSEMLLAATRENEELAFTMINLWSHSNAHGGYSHKPGSPAPGFCIVMSNLRLMQRQAHGVLATDFAACNAYDGGDDAANALHCPALFILGERDAMTPAPAGRLLASHVAGATVVTIERAGHALMAEAPDAVLESLVNFLGPAQAV